MQTVGLDEIRVASALDTDTSAEGVSFRRLPGWTRPQLTDIAHELAVTAPAGVRLELVTDARRIELDVLTFRLELNGRPALPAVFDLVVDGELVASEATDAGVVTLFDTYTEALDFRLGDPVTVGFDLDTEGPATVEIWLPHAAKVELRQLRVSDGATVAVPEERRPRWIHHGSSISHCGEATQPTGTWPAIVARRAGLDLQNLAFAGQCNLDPMVARTIRDLPADLISLKVGINIVNADSMRERTFGPALHGFLDTIRDGHPTTPVAVVTAIICPMVEDRPGPTPTGADHAYYAPARPTDLALGALTLRRTRELAAAVVAARREAGDENLHLIDGLRLFGTDDAEGLYDGLHPTADGYRLIGDRFHALAFEGSGPFASVAR